MKLKRFHIIDFRFQFDKHFFRENLTEHLITVCQWRRRKWGSLFWFSLNLQSKNVYDIASQCSLPCRLHGGTGNDVIKLFGRHLELRHDKIASLLLKTFPAVYDIGWWDYNLSEEPFTSPLLREATVNYYSKKFYNIGTKGQCYKNTVVIYHGSSLFYG